MYKTILFDLDGTLTESGEGIMKSVQYALEKIGKREDNLDNLRVFIGPPLLEQFMSYASIDKETAKLCVKYFRERFSTKGIFENKLYPNVEYVLKTLKDKGYLLAVSSSKPEFFVLQILEYFNIKKYFDEVVGSTLDEKRTAKSKNTDILICDTAGRLHNKKNLMNELNKIHRVIEREYPEARKEVLLVVDGTTGQNAIFQAKEFKEAAGLTGVAITKLDGTAKGGVVFPLQLELGLPVKLIGVGEQIDNLMEFNSDNFIDAIIN